MICKSRIITPLIFVSIFVLYASTAAQVPIGFADSDEFLTAGYTLGLPHPPGYPLLVVLTYLAMHISFLPSIYGAHLLSSLLQVITLIFIYKISIILVPTTSKKITLLSCTLLALTPQFWLTANYIEFMPLHNFITSMLVYLLLKRHQRLVSNYFLNLLQISLLWGIGLAHHQLILVFAPITFYVLYQTRFQQKNSQLFFALIGLLCIFALTYSEIIYLAGSPSYHWELKQGIGGIYNFFTRADYSGISVEQGGVQFAYWKGINIAQSLQGLIVYIVHLLPQAFGSIGLISLWGWKKIPDNKLRKFLVLLVSTSTIMLIVYLPILPNDNLLLSSMDRGLRERMYLNGYIWLLLPCIYFYAWLQEKVRHAESLMIIAVFFSLYLNFNKVNLHNFKISNNLIIQNLQNIPESSLIACFSDISCFGIIAAQQIQNQAPQVELLPIASQIHIPNLPQTKINYPDNPFRIMQSIAEGQIANRPIFTSQLIPLYINFLGLDSQSQSLSPQGLFNQVSCSSQSVYIPQLDAGFSRNYVTEYVASGIAENFAQNAYFLARQGKYEEARHYQKLTRQLFPNVPMSDISRIPVTKTACESPQTLIEQSHSCPDASCALSYAWWAISRDPLNRDLRQDIVSILENSGNHELAQRERSISLQLAQ